MNVAVNMVKKDGKRGKGLGEEDFRLWKAFTRDIDPLHGDAIADDIDPAIMPQPGVMAEKVQKKSSIPQPSIPSASLPKQPPQLDGRTELRLKRGQMPIDGRLDLHGCNQEQAHRLLHDFVMNAHGRGKRCLLVITGKGVRHEGGEGILKQRVPQWLGVPPLRDVVLKVFQAAPQHGGGGASYIYLKRQRGIE